MHQFVVLLFFLCSAYWIQDLQTPGGEYEHRPLNRSTTVLRLICYDDSTVVSRFLIASPWIKKTTGVCWMNPTDSLREIKPLRFGQALVLLLHRPGPGTQAQSNTLQSVQFQLLHDWQFLLSRGSRFCLRVTTDDH